MPRSGLPREDNGVKSLIIGGPVLSAIGSTTLRSGPNAPESLRSFRITHFFGAANPRRCGEGKPPGNSLETDYPHSYPRE